MRAQRIRRYVVTSAIGLLLAGGTAIGAAGTASAAPTQQSYAHGRFGDDCGRHHGRHHGGRHHGRGGWGGWGWGGGNRGGGGWGWGGGNWGGGNWGGGGWGWGGGR